MLSRGDSEYLTDYAIKNTWSNRRLESNVILKCNRFTTNLPRIGVVQYQGYSLSLPDNQHQYHLYIINAIPDSFLNLNSTGLYSWYSLDELNNRDALIVNVYDALGKVYPSTLCYLRRLPNGLIILAIWADSLPNMRLGTEDLRLQFYRNGANPQIKTVGRLIRTDADKGAFLNTLRQHQGMNGFCTLYKNGYFHADLSLPELTVGDYVEFTYDSGVKYVNVFDIVKLNSFLSEQYQTPYYLVMNWDEQNPNVNQMLYYRNDLTFYVTNQGMGNGRFIIRDDRSVVKQLTFQDVALRVTDVDYYLSLMEDTTNQTGKVVVVTRDDGQAQVWEGDSNRVTELYRTGNKEKIESLILGQTASVTEWGANALMDSPYIQMIESPYEFLDGNLVWEGLGAYAAEHVLLTTPHLEKKFKLSPSAAALYNVVYHKQGLVDGIASNRTESEYTTLANVDYCDIIQGKPCYNPGTVNGNFNLLESYASTVTLPLDGWFRCYVGEKDPVTQEILNWREIVRDSEEANNFFVITGNTLTWLTAPHEYATVVRFGNAWLWCANEFVPKTKDLRFKIETKVPFRELRVYINKHPAVEGIDFLVEWPYLSINNKSLLTPEGDNYIWILGLGFPACDCQYYANSEVGFINYGLISYDNTVYLRDWRNYRLVVGGKIVSANQVEWTEDHQGVYVGSMTNGLPYQITMPDCYTAVRDDMARVMESRAKEVDLDARVRAYLEANTTTPTNPTPPTYPTPYKLYSSFMSTIIKALQNGELTFTFEDIATYTLDVLLVDYLYLLPLDACVNDTYIRWDIVVVDPHEFATPLAVTFDQYQICEAINKYYLSERVSLAQLLRIGR